MRRKGKPKAKTRARPQKAGLTNDCDTVAEAGGEPDRARAGGEDHANCFEAPLISVSIASAGPSSGSTSSCEPNSRSSSLASDGPPEATATQQADDAGSTASKAPSCVVIFDDQSQTTKTSVKPPASSRVSKGQALSSGIELVRQSYIRLMARNSLQHFHLGALLYSVITMIVLLILLIYKQPNELDESDETLSEGDEPRATTRRGCDGNERQTRPNPASILRPLLVGLLLTTITQIIVILSEIYFASNAPANASTGQRPSKKLQKQTSDTSIQKSAQCKSAARCLRVLGVLLSVALLVAPIGALYGHRSLPPSCPGRPEEPPVILMSLIVYILPDLTGQLEPKKRLRRLGWLAKICVYLLVSAPWQILNVARHGNRFVELPLAMTLVGLLAGLRKKTIQSRIHQVATFKHAEKIIEAKVSLEQQRQQQETLLLSVLPAYVAEQVKRNMLKKMDSLKEEEPAEAAATTAGNQHEHLAVSMLNPDSASSSQAHTPTHAGLHGRSFTLPSSCEGPPQQAHQQPAATTSHEKHQVVAVLQSQRRSLANRLRLGSSFASSKLAQQQQHPAPSADQQAFCGSIPASIIATSGQQSRRGFNELYIRTYNNVSLLYGDIVGFTRLCTQLSSSALVCVLNNLFSYFDFLAEQHKIMRIKILGDCYYGVSGIPEFAVLGAKSSSPRHKQQAGPHSESPQKKGGDNHAINCVNMGLDMIQYIKRLNFGSHQQADEPAALPANFELNMRIGIHTGHIHSGVIGLKKWQFDVWSNDVSIAMHCESSGVAGRVQVTEATVQHLRNAFTFELATRSARDTFLADRSIQTYLIVDRVRPSSWCETASIATAAAIAPHVNHIGGGGAFGELGGASRASSYSFAPSEIQQMDEERIREATIGTIRQTLLSGEPTSIGGPLSAQGLARLDHNDMKWLSLEFKDLSLNSLYNFRPISSAGYICELCLVFLLLVALMQTINYHFAGQPDDQDGQSNLTAMIFAVGLALTLILVFAGLPKKPSRSSQSASRSARRRRTLPDIKRDLSPNSSGQRWRWPNWASNIDDKQAGLADEPVRESGNRCARMVQCIRSLGPVAVSSVGKNKRAANNLFGACSICAFLALFAAFQVYLTRNQVCLSESDPAEMGQIKRWSQIGALVLLFALDLSPSLLTYRAKGWLAAGLAALQLVALCASLSSSLATTRSGGSQMSWLCLGSTTPSKRAAANQPLRASDLIDCLSDALLLVLALWSLALSRRLEYSKRANFLWRNRLNVDHEELEYISGINKVLLENILPSHVVQHYLEQPAGCRKCGAEEARAEKRVQGGKSNQLASANCDDQCRRASLVAANQLMRVRNLHAGARSNARNGHELYHEQHENVAVMFASIPHFYEFYDESDISKQGLGCIALLNEIICDFDKLLLKNKFSRIEKIKTIGSTYMAAAGLRPSFAGAGRNSTASQISALQSVQPTTSDAPSSLGSELQSDRKLVLCQQKMNLICMIQFATSLMSALNGINKQSFQVFKLRVGVNTGPVVAGIIGAQRPFYDIWGDCVNIASRMESLGEVGRIQVEERTAKLLAECLCAETYSIERRGPIDVKGKGGMVTYFVDKKSQHQQQQSQPERICLAHESPNARQ